MLHRSILPAFSRRSLGRHLRWCSISGAAKNTTFYAFGVLPIFFTSSLKIKHPYYSFPSTTTPSSRLQQLGHSRTLARPEDLHGNQYEKQIVSSRTTMTKINKLLQNYQTLNQKPSKILNQTIQHHCKPPLQFILHTKMSIYTLVCK